MGYADPSALVGMSEVVDEAAVAAGRSPVEIKRVYNIVGSFGTGSGFLEGRPRDWAEQLAGLTLAIGTSSFVLGTDDPDDVRRFAAEVAPAVRELVERERAAGDLEETPDDAPAAPEPERFTLTPTPDDGTRLTGELDWDEAGRPHHAEPAGAAYPPDQQAAAQHLVDIHDGLRAELAQVRDVLEEVRRGQLAVGAARSVINTMTMRQNNWSLGAYCASYCRIVTGHHTLEDRSVFPHLRRSEPGLGPVLDRLEHEHEVIAEVLEQFDRALVTLVAEDGSGQAGRRVLDEVQRAVDLLTDTLLSHLAYEERELIGPLARHAFA